MKKVTFKTPVGTPFPTIRKMMQDTMAVAANDLAYRYKEGDGVAKVTYARFYSDVEALGAMLTAQGFGDAHIACVGENSYPWIVTYLTSLMSGGVYVPLDKELPEEELCGLLLRSESTILFYSAHYEEMLKRNRERLSSIKIFVGFGRESDDGDFRSFRKWIEAGRSMDKTAYDAWHRDPDEMKMLVFTSGTTGVAKGVMLTETNLVSGVHYGLAVSTLKGCGLSVLPYNHTYEAVCDILVQIRCANNLFINDNLKNVVANMQLAHPDFMCVVPAFSDLFYKNIIRNIEKQNKTRAFNKLIAVSEFLRHKLHIDLRRVFFKQIHKTFGGNLRRLVCGGAPIRPEVGMFFDKIGILMTGGYGITECSPLVSVNTEDIDENTFTTVGYRLPCLEWRIDNPNEEGIGEICVRGAVVMKGYYHAPEKTAEVLKDGWFYTGDYGKLTSDDRLIITGRKKNIIILANGKNIYPEEIENYISNVPYIAEVVVRGIKDEYGQEEGLEAEVYLSEPHDEKEVLKDIRASLSILPSYKNIARVKIRDTEFEKTTTRKIRRTA